MHDTVNETYLIQGVLALHWPERPGICRCKATFPTDSLMREHIAEQIALTLRSEP